LFLFRSCCLCCLTNADAIPVAVIIAIAGVAAAVVDSDNAVDAAIVAVDATAVADDPGPSGGG